MRKWSIEYCIRRPDEFIKYKNGCYFPIKRKDLDKIVKVDDDTQIQLYCKEFDIPFIPNVWYHLVFRARKVCEPTFTQIFHAYVCKMRLTGYREMTFEDSLLHVSTATTLALDRLQRY